MSALLSSNWRRHKRLKPLKWFWNRCRSASWFAEPKLQPELRRTAETGFWPHCNLPFQPGPDAAPRMDQVAVDLKSRILKAWSVAQARLSQRDATLRIFRRTGIQLLKSWVYRVGCARSSRVACPSLSKAGRARESRNPPSSDGHTTALIRKSVPQNLPPCGCGSGRDLLVHRGQSVRLVWTEGEIRVTVTALCLEAGSEGQTIKARILPRGRSCEPRCRAMGF